MAKILRSQKMLSEIELLLDAGNYEDARVLLTFLDDAPFDREGRLRLFLINVTLNGPGAYRDEIEQLSTLPNLSDSEKEIVERILGLAREAPAKEGSASDSAGHGAPAFEWPEDSMTPENAPSHVMELSREQELPSAPAVEGGLADRWLRQQQDSPQSRDPDALGLNPSDWRRQPAGSNRARDDETRVLREKLGRKEEILQARESELADIRNRFAQQIRDLEAELQSERARSASREEDLARFRAKAEEVDRATERMRSLEFQLRETKDLLAACESELDASRARVKTLLQERTEWWAERDRADRTMAETLRDHASLVQTMESSIAEMEAQKDEQIRLLELELAEKQIQLRGARGELDSLRGHMRHLEKRMDEAEAAKAHLEALFVNDASAAGANPPTTTAGSSDVPAIRHPPRPWQKRSWRIFLTKGESSTFTAAALPATAVSLLVLPLGYYLLGQPSGVSNPGGSARWEAVRERRLSLDSHGLSAAVREEDSVAEARGESTPNTREKAPRKNSAERNVNAGTGGSARTPGYVTRRAVLLRDWPRYAATAKAEIGPGTPVSVLGSEGSWLRVRTQQSGVIGYVRKEYLVESASSP